MEAFLCDLLLVSDALRILGVRKGLGRQEGSLVALTFQNSFFAFILWYARDLSLARGLIMRTSETFG